MFTGVDLHSGDFVHSGCDGGAVAPLARSGGEPVARSNGRGDSTSYGSWAKLVGQGYRGRCPPAVRLAASDDHTPARAAVGPSDSTAGTEVQTCSCRGLLMPEGNESRRVGGIVGEGLGRLPSAFEQAAVGIAHVGLDGRWLRVNQKLCDIVGYGHDEMMGLTFRDITHPDDLDADLADARRLLAGEITTYSTQKRYVRKDGSIVCIKLTVSLARTPEGQPDYFDRGRRGHLRAAAGRGAVPHAGRLDPAVVLDGGPGRPHRLVQPPLGRVHRQDAGADVGPEAGSPSSTPRSSRGCWSGGSESVASGEPFDMVFPIKGRDDVFRPFLTRVEPLRDDDGRVVLWFGTNTDISELKRAEEALREADRRKDEFLAMLAHELRNPLAPIRNALQIMQRLGRRPRTHRARAGDDRAAGGPPGPAGRRPAGRVPHQPGQDRTPQGGRRPGARSSPGAVETSRPLIDARRPRADRRRCRRSRCGWRPTRPGWSRSFCQPAEQRRQVHRPGRPDRADGRAGGRATCGDPGAGHRHRHRPPRCCRGSSTCSPRWTARSSRSQGGLGIGLTLVKSLVEMHGGSVEASERRAGHRAASSSSACPVAGRGGPDAAGRGADGGGAARDAGASWSWTTTWTRRTAWRMLLQAAWATRSGSPTTARRPLERRPAFRPERGPAGHRPAGHGRLRGGPPLREQPWARRHAAGRPDRLGAGGGPPPVAGGRLRPPPGQARGPGRPGGAAGRSRTRPAWRRRVSHAVSPRSTGLAASPLVDEPRPTRRGRRLRASRSDRPR